MSWLMSNWLLLLTVVLTAVGGASVVVKAIAPLTNTKIDDWVGGALSWIHNLLSKIALNPKDPGV